MGCGLHSQTGWHAEYRNLQPYLESNSSCPSCSLINIVTELSRILTLVKEFTLFTTILLVGKISGFLPLITHIDISLHSDINVLRSRNKVTESITFKELCFNFLHSFYTSTDIVNVSQYFSEAWLHG